MIEPDTEDGGAFYVACDFCSVDLSVRASRFVFAVEIIKGRGWRVLPPKGAEKEWRHKCPACIKEAE